MHALAALVVLFLGRSVHCLHAGTGPSGPGSPICPCIAADHPLAPRIQERLRQIGEADQYGFQGCEDYDASNPALAAADRLGASLRVDAREQERKIRADAQSRGFCAGPNCTLNELRAWAKQHATGLSGALGAFALGLARQDELLELYGDEPHLWCMPCVCI